MLISPTTFINGTEVDCSNYEHRMPYAALIQTPNGYAVHNHMTGINYMACWSLEGAVRYCNREFDCGFYTY